MAAMSERELVEHRRRNGLARKRLSPVMELVEADHLSRVAEHGAGNAEQSPRTSGLREDHIREYGRLSRWLA